jgi:acyl carrier protein
VAPSSSLEQQLAQLWARVLGVEKVGIHDNFFNLGGHSLLAVRLFAEMEKVTGQHVPLITLFQSPTIAELARMLREQRASARRSSIVPIQPLGAGQPLYLVHGAGGGMLWGYANLARHLGTDRPVHALLSRAMEGLDELPSVEAMAAQYVAELCAFQPTGPYCIGGYCFGRWHSKWLVNCANRGGQWGA